MRDWALVVITSLALIAFAAIAERVSVHAPTGLDVGVRAWVLGHQWGPAAALALAAAVVGAAPAMMVAGVLVALWLWRVRGRPIAAAALAAPLASDAAFVAVKAWVRRARPAGALQLDIRSYAFPSGHATVAAAVLASAAYILHRERLLGRPAALALGVAGPLVIGASRIYLDVHWTTDVLGGWALGAAIAALGVWLYEHLRAAAAHEPGRHAADACAPNRQPPGPAEQR